MQNFWDTLSKPFFVLAPMADVTDAAFRRIIAQYGKPDVMWTEFVSADGLYHTREFQHLVDDENPLMRDLLYSEAERPIVAQLFSANPNVMEYAARLIADLGFDGVDINMGCPDRSIVKQGAGAALMRDVSRARALIRAAKQGVQGRIPVSVKTRIGDTSNDIDTWLPALLAEEPAAITVHARTRSELSKVPARWEHVREAVVLRNKLCSTELSTRIIGNGDLVDLNDAHAKVKESGADGAMLGRAIFGNPWLWSGRNRDTIPLAERLDVLVEHCRLYENLLPHKSFSVMKKHFKSYLHGLPNVAVLRNELMSCNDAGEVARTVVQQHRAS